MNLSQILLPAIVLLLVAAGIRWQVNRTVDRAVSSDQSWAIPVTTPFIPTLCKGKPDCFDLAPDDPIYLAP